MTQAASSETPITPLSMPDVWMGSDIAADPAWRYAH